jgi:hypothetical protein
MAHPKILLPIFFCFAILVQFSTQSPALAEEPVEDETQANFDGLSKNPDDVQFFLYSNAGNPSAEQELKLNDLASVRNSNYDASKRLIVYISGFLQNRTSDQAVKNAYLQAGFASSANILVVEWGPLSGNKVKFPASGVDLFVIQLYAAVKENVNPVGRRVKDFLNFLNNNGLIAGGMENAHLVGQSMGAHVSGQAGLYFKQDNGITIGRITGTDPAGPLYQGILKTLRLDASDASFVDIVHTNAGGYGYSGNIGHADFMVNGGKAPQPGCDGTEAFCSHNLAVVYYAKSILDTSIRGFSSNNQEVQFGEYCPPTASGEYTVTTSPDFQ